MGQNTQRKKKTQSAKKTAKSNSASNSRITLSYLDTLKLHEEQTFKIPFSTLNGFKKIDIAVIEPNGKGWLSKPERNVDDYSLTFTANSFGKYYASIVAYGKHGTAVVENISFDVQKSQSKVVPTQNNGVKTAQKSKQVTAPTKSKTIPVPSLPQGFKKDEIKSWPNSSSYAQSLQNLKFSVSDNYASLKQGELIKNPNIKYTSYIFGSGNFGTVFKVFSEGKNYAIKCFTRAAPDLAERYFYISYYLSSFKFPFLVDFSYLPSAVRQITKPDTYYPILKMEWIEGESLNGFISKNLGNPKKIRLVANHFLNNVITLQSSHLAHGDLSGDNILIDSSGRVKFIDFDGMYVPAFKGKISPEKGHEHYQHPKRDKQNSEFLDNFSSLIIYTSLIAITKQPKVWEYNQGDGDRLIFSVDDFTEPSSSDIVKELKGMGGKVKSLTNLMIKSLSHDPLWEGISPEKIKALR